MADTQLQSDEQRVRARSAPVLGLCGTLILCAAAMMAHLSPAQTQTIAAVMWLVGFAMQAGAFILALLHRRSD